MTKRAPESDTSESQPEAQVPSVVAANVRRIRLHKGQSLEQLARTSGVARSTLEQLEAGSHEPTIKTLWSLATALSVPFSALIAPETASNELRKRDSVPPPGASARKVIGARDERDQGVYELKLSAHATETASPRTAGAQENVLVTQGSATIEAGGTRYTLATGESVIFPADTVRSYSSLGDSDATLYVVVSQAEAR